MGTHHDDRAHMITPKMFGKDFYVLGFDMTPDREADGAYINLLRLENAFIEARFKKTLPEPVTRILYANSQQISKSATLGKLL